MRNFLFTGFFKDTMSERSGSYDIMIMAKTPEEANVRFLTENPDWICSETDIREIGLEDDKFGPLPTCCVSISKRYPEDFDFNNKPPVRLVVTDLNYENLIDEPYWVLSETNITISFCPFCGQKLPNAKRKDESEIEGKMIRAFHPRMPQDYCGNCDQRLMVCECSPMSVSYKVLP